ncbi:hypothetical protein Trydic_g11110 [Trypoxylus dichotomus]
MGNIFAIPKENRKHVAMVIDAAADFTRGSKISLKIVRGSGPIPTLKEITNTARATIALKTRSAAHENVVEPRIRGLLPNLSTTREDKMVVAICTNPIMIVASSWGKEVPA